MGFGFTDLELCATVILMSIERVNRSQGIYIIIDVDATINSVSTDTLVSTTQIK